LDQNIAAAEYQLAEETVLQLREFYQNEVACLKLPW